MLRTLFLHLLLLSTLKRELSVVILEMEVSASLTDNFSKFKEISFASDTEKCSLSPPRPHFPQSGKSTHHVHRSVLSWAFALITV